VAQEAGVRAAATRQRQQDNERDEVSYREAHRAHGCHDVGLFAPEYDRAL
jgi:hypothetical protein